MAGDCASAVGVTAELRVGLEPRSSESGRTRWTGAQEALRRGPQACKQTFEAGRAPRTAPLPPDERRWEGKGTRGYAAAAASGSAALRLRLRRRRRVRAGHARA
eukprot:3502012-Rhodomonas_salina.2